MKVSLTWALIGPIVGLAALVYWPSGHALSNYEASVLFGLMTLASFLFFVGESLRKEIDGRLSAMEQVLRDILQTSSDRPASMHEYLSEQAGCKTTERLDGRTDSDVETEHNPESHDLVVKGIKCLSIGDDYHYGRSVPENQVLAEAWYRKAIPFYESAAKLGDSYAQETLGDLYSKGRGIPRSEAQAIYWWRKSADNGRADAQYCLGQKYYFGQDLEKSFAEALYWFNIALNSHPAGFAEMKRQAARYGDDSASHLTPAELSDVQERVRRWLKDHYARTGTPAVGG